MTAHQKQRQLADALARIRAIGIDNLLDTTIQPRQPPNATQPHKKALLHNKETSILQLEKYPPKLINQLDTLYRIMRDPAELKRQVLAEVRARQDDPRHPQQMVREVMAKDLGSVICRHNFARAAERKRKWVERRFDVCQRPRKAVRALRRLSGQDVDLPFLPRRLEEKVSSSVGADVEAPRETSLGKERVRSA